MLETTSQNERCKQGHGGPGKRFFVLTSELLEIKLDLPGPIYHVTFDPENRTIKFHYFDFSIDNAEAESASFDNKLTREIRIERISEKEEK